MASAGSHARVSSWRKGVMGRVCNTENDQKTILQAANLKPSLFAPGSIASSGAPGALSRAKLRIVAAVYGARKSWGLYAADLLSAALALVFSFLLRYSMDTTPLTPEALSALKIAGLQYIVVCALIFPLAGLYSRNWRYATVSDILLVIRAVLATTVILICALFIATRLQSVPRTAIVIDALLLTCFLCASRLGYRMSELRLLGWDRAFHDRAGRIPTLLIGAGDGADLYLRAISRDNNCAHMPIGCLDINGDHKGKLLRGVPIIGAVDQFRDAVEDLKRAGQSPRHIIFTEAPAVFGEELSERLLKYADKVGITASRLSQITELRNATRENRLELRSIELTDLLERSQRALDHEAIIRLVRGRRVIVTGAGGSIGSELTLQIAACEPAEIVLIESTEYNLYAIDLELSERFPNVPRAAHLCNIRRSKRVNDIFDLHQPELVFHAAALKHVPMVELNPCEGALTNVIGTMNVANATRRVGALAMVQISTDKVVNPTSFMGATKRLAELYCQALDISGYENLQGPRFMTVRFGNVLGSSGSLIPLFKRQLAKGGPLTVTDEKMTRFFMTIREAVELTLQASSYGLEGEIGQGEIFVLDMGEPIKIVDIARRMIKLSGLRPDIDIKIQIIGLRPGEKHYEELFDLAEERVESPVPGVLGAIPVAVPLQVLEESFAKLQQFGELGDEANVVEIVQQLIPGYQKSKQARPRIPAAALGIKSLTTGVRHPDVPAFVLGNELAAPPVANQTLGRG
jgi:FlaA1/EpsC-like NDP-sugar epimerase